MKDEKIGSLNFRVENGEKWRDLDGMRPGVGCGELVWDGVSIVCGAGCAVCGVLGHGDGGGLGMGWDGMG